MKKAMKKKPSVKKATKVTKKQVQKPKAAKAATSTAKAKKPKAKQSSSSAARSSTRKVTQARPVAKKAKSTKPAKISRKQSPKTAAKPLKKVAKPLKKVAKPQKKVATPSTKATKPLKKVAKPASKTPVPKVTKKAKATVAAKVSSKAAKAKAVLARKASQKPVRKPVPVSKPEPPPKTITRKKDLKIKAVKQQKADTKAAKVIPVEVTAPVVRKPKLKADELRKLRSALEHERQRLLQEIRTLDDHTLTDRLDEGNNHQPGYSQHLADSAADNQEMETALGIRSIEAEQLMAIDEAMRALDGGDYGICRRCGEAISIERLLVKPMAQYCVPCRRLLEIGKA